VEEQVVEEVDFPVGEQVVEEVDFPVEEQVVEEVDFPVEEQVVEEVDFPVEEQVVDHHHCCLYFFSGRKISYTDNSSKAMTKKFNIYV
jgi:hypothetical protein